MKIDCVLDTSALVAHIRGEPGGEGVRRLLESGKSVMHALNVAEFCFTAPRRLPELFTPESAMAWFDATEVGMADVLDAAFLKLTARIRLAARALNIGDGVAAALASSLDVPIVTADRNFKHAREYVRIELIR